MQVRGRIEFLLFLIALGLTGCSQEQQNKLSRIGVTWIEGNYHVTFVEGNHIKTWTVVDGKVTSDPEKGYYYFWVNGDGGKLYVQAPIARSYIEEFK